MIRKQKNTLHQKKSGFADFSVFANFAVEIS